MATNRINLYPFPTNVVTTGSVSVIATYGIFKGGFISNPPTTLFSLFVDFTGPAATAASGTTTELLPGGTIELPENDGSPVWVNAFDPGHQFSGLVYRDAPDYPPNPLPGNFPPTGPTVATKIIPSYLYVEYNDDEDLAAFVAAYNEMAQSILTWFVEVGLPVYTGLSGALLDWVAEGLYGIKRPSLPSGTSRVIGPLNTYGFNQAGVTFNYFRRIGSTEFFATSDDTFKRIITWHFFKGDGRYFSVRWLKRRVQRFLDGVDGAGLGVVNTFDVSVSFSGANTVHIDVGVYNTILKAAIDAGVLELPFQFQYQVTIP